MAGEWLKMECATPDKPEVLAIAAKMGWDDPDLAVGKLFRLWRWFDQQTTDGNACGVTPALLDRQVGVSGFIQAVAEVGWLKITTEGISLANFDRHNGKTAKERALTAKRVANHKANGEGNAVGNGEANLAANGQSVSDALARKEEEKKKKPPKAPQGAPEVPDWIPPEAWSEFVSMRRAKGQRSPFTVGAAKGVVAKLATFRQAGFDLAAILQQSTINGWADVFEPKGRPAAQSHPQRQETFV